jgi:formylglycine-generating enzyme required for sulfatase activity
MGDRQLPDLAFCYIPAGDFWMGSDESDPEVQKHEQPQHRLALPYSYWLGKYPVTVAQYETFVAAGGYKNEKYWTEAQENRQWQGGRMRDYQSGEDWRERPYNHGERFNTPNHPIVGLTWYEALAFCRWLTGQMVLPDGCEITLPSEAEWEKGARGGLLIPETAVVADLLAGLPDKPLYDLVENNAPTRRYPWGQAFGPEQSNFDATGIQATCSVGIFPNDVSSYGLVDLGGNVFEWMRTVWGKDFEEPDFNYPYVSTDGREALLSADLRVLRGGVWPGGSEWLRCAARFWSYPFNRFNYLGFRVVMRPHFSPADER